ncbi:MAG: glycosyltransferase, partial [Bacteroidales bacterium]|nr:glycosyltransferase [Bacteroidales bacterium]
MALQGTARAVNMFLRVFKAFCPAFIIFAFCREKPTNSVNTKPIITIICPVYNEERFIDGLVQSILNQDYPKDRMEVLMIDGQSKDKTKEKIEAYIRQNPCIRLYENPLRYSAQAMNMGIRKAKGEVIIRMDAHCVYPSNYFRVLVERLFELGADNVGAGLNT